MSLPTIIAISIASLSARRSAIRALTRIGCNIIADGTNISVLHIYCYTTEQLGFALTYLK